MIIFDPASLGYSIPPITLEVFAICLFCGMLFTITSLYGMKGLEIIAIPVSPVIMAIAVFVGISMLQEGGGITAFIEKSSLNTGMSLSTGITMLIGSWIAGAIMGVDLFRFNKNVRAVLWGAAACFIFTNPLLNIVGYIGTITVGQPNYVQWMMDKSFIFALVGVLTWTLSLWTTNDAELYCNAMYTGPVLKSYGVPVNKKKLILTVGIIGSILGSIGFYQIFFAQFINYLGIMAPPLAGPLLADYYLIRRQRYDLKELNSHPSYNWIGIISAIVGMFLGLIFVVQNILTEWPTGLLALFITVALYTVLRLLVPHKAVVISQ